MPACAISRSAHCRSVSTHQTFDEWWQPYTLGVGPAGKYAAGLDPARQERAPRPVPQAAAGSTVHRDRPGLGGTRIGLARPLLYSHGMSDDLVRSLETLREELEQRERRFAPAPTYQAVASRSASGSVRARTSPSNDSLMSRYHDQLVHQLAAVDAASSESPMEPMGCARWGRHIAPERLEAIPWAATCVACA